MEGEVMLHIKFPTDVDTAVDILRNEDLTAAEREGAIRFLEQEGSEDAIKALVFALTDDNFSVRWVAGTALARLGDRAIPFVLEEITQNFNLCLRDSVYHVLHYNYGLWTQWHTGPLMKALRSVVPDVTAPKEAANLLAEYRASSQAPEVGRALPVDKRG
jgi:hypothetical protein